jgi:hypothetical protein
VQAKPKQIGLNPQQRFRSIPWGIEVVNSQEPLTSAAAGLKPRQQRRLEIAEMQNTRLEMERSGRDNRFAPQPVALIELEKEMVRTTH